MILRNEERITGATHPLHLGKHKFAASRLSDTDITELDIWVRNQYIHTVKSSFTPQTTQREREESLDIAFRTAATLSAFTGTGARILATVEGMTRLIWQTIKTNHPHVSEETLHQLLLDPENIEECNRVFKTLNMPDTANLPANSGKKGGKNRKRRNAAHRQK